MPVRLLLLACLLLCSHVSVAELLRFNIPQSGYPPYLLEHPMEQGRGIVYDVLAVIAQKQDIQIEVLNIPRKRVEQLLSHASLDATMAAIEWIDNPQRFIFTEPIMKSEDALFSPVDHPLAFYHVGDLFDKRIGTKLGYKYPLIEPYTIQKKITRVDTLTVEAMLKMLLAKRADAAIVNRAAGLWVIKHSPELKDRFAIATKAINTFEVRLMFHQRWAPFVIQFNRELEMLKQSGELAAIIARYR